jgi:C-terminal peptidase prc
MNSTLRLPLMAALFVVVSVHSGQCAEKAKPHAYVLLAGVGHFDDPSLAARPTAENDAKALYDLFVDPQYLGVDSSDIRILLSTEDKTRHSTPATRENILKALTWISETAGKSDLVIIGLFGRGASVGDRTCFFCPGSTVKDRARDAVNSRDVEQAIKSLKTEKLLALMDIDYNVASLNKDAALEPNIIDLAQVFAGDEDAEEQSLPPGRIAFMASATVARHLDNGQNGIFVHAVIDALKGKADTEGYEPDGVVTVDELRKYLDTAVIAQARTLGKNNLEKEQSPFVWGTRLCHFALTRSPSIAAKNDARIVKLAKMELPKEMLDEGARLIGRMPKLKAQQELRKQFVRLTDDSSFTASQFTETYKKIHDEMKLDREAAEAFARRTLFGLETIRRSYVRELQLGELTNWAIKGLYQALEVSLPAELNSQLQGVESAAPDGLANLLADAREQLGRREDLERNKDVDIAMKTAMFNLDPYSMYIDHEQIAQMQSRLMGQFTGIGIHVRRDMVRDGLVVISPIKDSPAYQAGVRTGDLITEIIRDVDSNGKEIKPPEVTSTKGMKSDEAVEKILGLPGTKVRIKVAREGIEKPLEFELLRSQIDVETVLGVKRQKDDSWDFMIDPAKHIAYIRLTEFAPRSYEGLEEAMKRLSGQDIRGLVLDLRFNPGGLLTAAVQISNMFIEDGLIVTIKPRPGVDDETAYSGQRAIAGEKKYSEFPMVCLINGQSASASEILSACLQDQQRAIIMGERSYGKGSVQTIVDFPTTHGKIKLTTATFWRPNGKNLNKPSTSGRDDEDWGVRPDAEYVIPQTRAERDALFDQLRELEVIPNPDLKAKEAKPQLKDKQLEAALNYLRSQIKS